MSSPSPKCASCITGAHAWIPHSWLGQEEAHLLDIAWPLSQDQTTARPCSCECAIPRALEVS